ncbi:hypothetical protein R83H12_02067 [Fibrobacteria bacterium R8-3-H12]
MTIFHFSLVFLQKIYYIITNMLYNLRDFLPLAIIFVMIPCGLVFADTVYLKNGEKIENATIAEITPTEIKYKIGERAVVYTISKNDAIKIVYRDGS